QHELAVVTFDVGAGTGAIAGTPILTAGDDAWVNVHVGIPRWLDDGSGFLWMTEASDQWVLERRAPDGSLVAALTRPELGLRDLAGVDADGAVVEASAE